MVVFHRVLGGEGVGRGGRQNRRDTREREKEREVD